ncbi:hypothetical protein AAE478_004442 [Parahypoxylon ruwenzoriense]
MKMFVILFFHLTFVLLVNAQHHLHSVGNWTVSDALRTSSVGNQTCYWRFLISQSEAPPDTPPTLCEFFVEATGGQSCDLVSFTGVPCHGTEKYSVNAGHSELGFIVMVLHDVEEDAEAYFGFDDQSLSNGTHIPEQIVSAYPPSSMVTSRSPARNPDRHSSSLLSQRATNITWMIDDLYRTVVPEENLILIDMMILDGSPNGVLCRLNLHAPPDADPKTWAFSNAKCLGNDWIVHWGYLPDHDAGVMTVVP